MTDSKIVASTHLQNSKSPSAEDDARQKLAPFREDDLGKFSAVEAALHGVESRNPLGAIGNDGSEQPRDDKDSLEVPEVVDPLAGMAEVDKWGIKGLRTLMNNYPDYHAMVVGMDPSSFGLDMSSQE